MIGGRIGVAALSIAALLALGGCESARSGLFGSAATEAAETAAAGRMTPTGQPDPSASGPMRVDFDPEAECPQINVPAGTSAYSSYAGAPSPDNVRFQARISEFARECILNPGNTVTFKIGVQGLVILGEKGSPGTFPAPLLISVRDRDGKIVGSNAQRLSVAVPAGSSQARFKIVDNSITVPIGLDMPLRSYEILIGFDEKGGAAPARAKARARG